MMGLRYQFELKVKSITDVILFHMDTREYDQLDALRSSSSMEISQLSVIIKDLKERVQSLESNQTDLMDKINALEREKTG
jgi:predicted  nucleic acid-binding Zn-ribbon protein